jgi:hypothetical protein
MLLLIRYTGITLSLVLILGTGLLNTGCEEPSNAGAHKNVLIDENGLPNPVIETLRLPSPAPPENMAPPEKHNQNRYYRTRLETASGTRPEPDVILVMVPGIICGNVYHAFSQQIVKQAFVDQNRIFEVLVVERRQNIIEDHTGLDAAEAARDAQIALDYYWHDAEVNGKRFQGFVGDAKAQYLSEFGLQLFIEDIQKVIAKTVPDPAERRRKVFLGGHSQAGAVLAYYAGWDFDGDPTTLDDAGYNNLAGLIALDCSANTVDEKTSETAQNLGVGTGTRESYESLLKSLRDHTTFLTLPFTNQGVSRELFVMLELLAMKADFQPDEEATTFNDLPLTELSKMVVNAFHARNTANFLGAGARIKEFRYTNEALFGIIFDNQFMPAGVMKTGLGFLTGGKVVRKQFPFEDLMAAVPALNALAAYLLDTDDLYIAAEPTTPAGPGPLYTWVPFDEIGDKQNPDFYSPDGEQYFTSIKYEVTEMHEFAKMWYAGPSNFADWYYTIRYLVDLDAAAFPFGRDFGLSYHHGVHLDDIPRITLTGQEAHVTTGPTDDRPPNELHVIRGYNHLDVISACADRPERRKNEVIGPIIDFVLKQRH